jgi:hypothetical protein
MASETPERLEQIERQLALLRRQTRLLRLLTVVSLLVAAVSLGARWVPMRMLRAGSFEVVDALGQTKARLSDTADGASLVFFDQYAKPRTELRLEGTFGTLRFLDDDGAARSVLDARPSLRLIGEERSKLSMLVNDDGPALEVLSHQGYATLHPEDGVKLYSANGTLVSALTPGALSLYSALTDTETRGKLSVTLAAPRRLGERPRLLLYDDLEQPAFSAP